MNESFKYVTIGLMIMILANFAGHYFPPFSLFSSFIYINVIIAFINLKLYKINFRLTAIYNFILLIVNDLLIRYYAGGNHDSVGMAICTVMFCLGFIISVIIMTTYSLTNFKESKLEKISNFNVVIIGTFITAMFYYFVNITI